MIFDEPTRGIDVGAKSEIYELMRALADAGVAVLMISSDMEEVIGVSDRIAVMHEGRISGFLERERVQRAERAAAGRRRTAEAEGRAAMLKKDLGLLVLILVVGARGRAHQPALPLADQPRQHRQPGRPVRPVRDRPGLRHHHRRHRAVGRLDDRAARRHLRRPDRQSSTCPGRWPSLIVLAIGCADRARCTACSITKLQLQPFVVTLCGLLIYRGIARFYTEDATAGFAFGAELSRRSNG